MLRFITGRRVWPFLAWGLIALVAALLGNPELGLAGVLVVGQVDYADISILDDPDVQSTFKRVYLMAVDAIPEANALSAQFERTRKFRAGPDGLYFNVKLETGGKVANVPDGKLLPGAASPKRRQGKTNIAHTYTVVAIGGQSIALTEDRKSSFLSNLEDQLTDGMVRVRNDVERQDNGDGRGILCTLETVAGAPTYGVQNPYAKPNAGPGTMLLIEEMDVAIINPANGQERGRATIIAGGVDYDNDTMTLSAAVPGAAIGDYVVRCNDVDAAGVDAVNNLDAEAAGIQAAIAEGDTFEDIDGNQFRRWSGIRLHNNGAARPVTEKLIAKLEASIKARSGRKPNLHYTTRGISIELQDQLRGLRRFDGERIEANGYEALKLQGRTVIEGDWCPKGRWFALNTDRDVVGTMDLVPMGYVDLDGARLHRIEGRHAYRADLWFPHNLIWFMRSAHGVLEDLIDDNEILR